MTSPLANRRYSAVAKPTQDIGPSDRPADQVPDAGRAGRSYLGML